MTPRLAAGITLFIAGAVLWRLARSGRLAGPRWLPRLGAGVATLGLGTMTLAQPGLWWSVGSIIFGALAVALLATIVLENLRR